MSEEITNTDTAALNTEAATLENNAYDSTELYTQDPQADGPEDVVEDDAPDTETSEQSEQTSDAEDTDTTQKHGEMNEDLARRLKEYELHQEEQAMLRQRLGINDNVSDEEIYLANLEQSVVNRGHVAYLDLCNKFGVNADLDNLDATLEDLKKTDPAKGYEFERQVERLADQVTAKRNEITNTRFNSGVAQFERDNAQVLSISPTLTNTLSQVVQANAGNPNIYQILNDTMAHIQAIYSEAFNYGKQYNSMETARRNTSGVEGSITKDINQTTVNSNVMTRRQIERMSQAEFEKNYDAIMDAYAKGRIVD